MIKLLKDAAALNSFEDICGIKLRSLAVSYGLDQNFCTFWLQENENSLPTAVIGKFGSAVTVSYMGADLKELTDFIEFIGFSELVCEEKLAARLKGYATEEIYWVEKSINPRGALQKDLNFSDYRRIHGIFTASNSNAISIGNFEDWYVDISHRVRHGGAAVVLNEYGCGIALLAKNSAIINGIAVVGNSRGQGHGRELLYQLEGMGNIGRSMAFCMEEELPFYKKCGYKLKEKYSLVRKGQKNNA